MFNDDSGQERLEVVLVVFLLFVLIIALLTILSPQIEGMVQTIVSR